MSKKYGDHNLFRLALDIGSSSIGWAIHTLNGNCEPCALVRTGVRMFSNGRDPETEESLAVTRRVARQARRMRDRYVQRRQYLLSSLKKYDLMSDNDDVIHDLVTKNPLELRARALDEEITLHELGRALFHLSKRRGFKSNRKTDKKEGGKISAGIVKTAEQMKLQNARTYGELLYRKHSKRETTKVRFDEKNKKDPYLFYPQRTLIEEEFDKIWDAQTGYHTHELTDEARKVIRSAIFRQRPLRTQKVGLCSFEPDQERAAKALPITQEFIVRSELNNLMLREEGMLYFRALTADERELIYKKLNKSKEVKFEAIVKDLLKRHSIAGQCRFNLEHDGKKAMIGNATNAVMAHKDRFGDQWYDLTDEQRNLIVSTILSDSPDEEILSFLTSGFGLAVDKAGAVAHANLPDGYIRLSEKALKKIVPHLREGMTYDKACAAAGYEHHLPLSSEVLPELPYYGELLTRHILPGDGEEGSPDEQKYGKIANPTVHVALNELRKVVNAIIRKYGNPRQIVLELARDLPLGADGRKELESKQTENQRKNKEIIGELEKIGVKPTYDSILRYRLWEEQLNANKLAVCIYTGDIINLEAAMSAECEIEHILPYARTHDDSISNKTLCFMSANRDKGNRSPYEAFGATEGYAAILERANRLPKNKRWRFEKDAMERYANEDQMMDRQLNDTRYISKVAREYLYYICKTVPNSDNKDVWTVNGSLTALFRQVMGLNNILSNDGGKNRNDHRHHAVDALAIGLISRSMIQRVHSLAEKSAGQDRNHNIRRVLSDLPVPFPRGENAKEAFHNLAKKSIEKIIVSHKPDHGKEGQLHEDTAYGMLPDGTFFVHKVVDEKRSREIPQKIPTIPICRKGETEPYKYFISGSNFCVDIVDIGKKCIMEGTTTFEANKQVYQREWQKKYPDARLLMRLHKNDVILHNGEYCVIAKLDPSNNRVICVHMTDARDSKNRKNVSISITALSKDVKHVVIDVLGNCHPAREPIE